MHIQRILKLFCLLLLLDEQRLPAQDQPNIIFIIADDVSKEDISCYGNTMIKTPTIDQLAAGGIQFDNMFVTASSCSPSRTSILTGRYPHNTGAAELHSELPMEQICFPELLKKSGYYTVLAGKWHEGRNTKRAYDTVFSDLEANGEGGENQWRNILRDRPKEKPFFFWFAPYDAHRNWSTNGLPFVQSKDSVRIPPTLIDGKRTRKDLAGYNSEIQRIDYYMGLLNKELKAQGIEKNTIIVFTSDNGRPFPGSKTLLYDRGVNMPFIFYWPEKIKQGLKCGSLVSSIDIAPTLLSIAGLKIPDAVQGLPFTKLLSSPQEKFRNYVFAEHNWHDYEAYERMVRTEDYLLIVNKRTALDNQGGIDSNQSDAAKDLRDALKADKLNVLQRNVFLKPRPAIELYNNPTDKLQENNLAEKSQYQPVVTKLKTVLETWQKETGDTEPENLTPDWYDRKKGKKIATRGKRGSMPGSTANAEHINNKGPF